ncbi:MAG: hypothetical protein E6H09_05155 [Bacteroidetes bacterium]|nr:MAG: hypothetical protein E6H09_05155 [Bacteroidota bacterium]
MIKRLTGFIAAFISLHAVAQITVNVQLPQAGMMQKDQLWNLVLMNNSSDVFETTVSITLQDAASGQQVLSGGTRSFMLGKGIKVLGYRDVEPVQYNYIAAEFTTNYIPLGSYVACYRVMRNGLKGPEPLADECVRLNISPLSPPLLNTPADRSVLQTIYPQFTWLPPSPAEMFNNLNYDLVVAEVSEGQSPAEAVMKNEPVYVNGNIKNPVDIFPSSYSSLKPGKTYAWQVTARNGLNYAAKTEVWTFSIKQPDTGNPMISSSYIILRAREESSGISYISNEELLVKYYSSDNDHETSVRFLSADGKPLRQVNQKIVYGDNFLKFKLGKEFQKGIVYIIEISDKQNRVSSSKFSVQ